MEKVILNVMLGVYTGVLLLVTLVAGALMVRLFIDMIRHD